MSEPRAIQLVVTDPCPIPASTSSASTLPPCGQPLRLNQWDQPTCPVHGVVPVGIVAEEAPNE